MIEFIEKYKLAIGTILIALILSGTIFLLWQKQSGKVFSHGSSQEISSIRAENQDLKNKIAELEEKLKSNESGQVKSAVSVESNSESVSKKININSADLKTLDSLPGIGSTRANLIIEYRQAHNGFKNIEEIMKISGIGNSIFLKIKDKITVE